MTWHRPPLTDEELRLIRIRDRDKTDVLAVTDRRDLLAEVERLRAEKAEAWDEGFTSGFYTGTGPRWGIDSDASEPNVTNPYEREVAK